MNRTDRGRARNEKALRKSKRKRKRKIGTVSGKRAGVKAA
jgi:hypothetical protein